jgi:pyruvyl transferase EpsI
MSIYKKIKIKLGKLLYLKYLNGYNYFISSKYKNQFAHLKNRKKIILTLTPTHGNLGDHAIAFASKKYLEENFKDYEIIELNMFEIYKYGKAVYSVLTPNDFIFLIGGGNMNNLYDQEEWTRRFVIKTFNDIPIVSLPQTINFTKDQKGQGEFHVSKRIYNRHKNLTVIAREEKSYGIMDNAFTNANVLLNPDMVLYLENMKLSKNVKRNNILVCLRNDKEMYISVDKRDEIIGRLKDQFENVEISDTVINESIGKDLRERELKKIWEQFSSSKVVVTDRLHGMIFAVITKTPCVVIRNSDHKITESYKWIESLNYIRLIDDFSYETIHKNIGELSNIKEYNSIGFKGKYFTTLKSRIVSGYGTSNIVEGIEKRKKVK